MPYEPEDLICIPELEYLSLLKEIKDLKKRLTRIRDAEYVSSGLEAEDILNVEYEPPGN